MKKQFTTKFALWFEWVCIPITSLADVLSCQFDSDWDMGKIALILAGLQFSTGSQQSPRITGNELNTIAQTFTPLE